MNKVEYKDNKRFLNFMDFKEQSYTQFFRLDCIKWILPLENLRSFSYIFISFIMLYTEYFTLRDCFRFSQIRSGPVNEAL